MTGDKTTGAGFPATARAQAAHGAKEIQMVAEAAAEFAAGQLTPDREANDRYPYGPFFSDVVQKAFDLDFFHLMLPEALNGMQMGASALAVVLENICRADSSLGGIIFTTVAAQQLMQHAGSTDHLERICAGESANDFLVALPVFNNPSEVKHLAEAWTAGGRYLLSGQMEYMVLGGLARHALVPAQREGAEGFSYFLVDLEDAGIRKSDSILSLGLRACPAVDLELVQVEGMPVGREGEGAFYFDKMADRLHAAAAAMSLGVMKGSFSQALEYARRREQGGQPIIRWSEVKMILANMAVKISNAEMVVAQACAAVDGRIAGWQARSRAAALHVQEMACHVTTDGIQVLGGVGYMKDFGQEKRFRDAKQLQALMGIAPVKKIKFLDAMR
ncbi:MAG: acyl-CoA dehydrogenase family protein [Desulfobacteraceae bacterium]|jgi:alkylation response protein AidB-like acyl-CoA dehydrogenase